MIARVGVYCVSAKNATAFSHIPSGSVEGKKGRS